MPMARNALVLSSWNSFSAPMASATSYCPDATAIHARWNADAAEAQAFSTLKMGMPSRPGVPQRGLSADHLLAGHESRDGVGEKAVCTSFGSEAGVLERVGHRFLGERAHARSRYFPKRVIPVPATKTLSA